MSFASQVDKMADKAAVRTSKMVRGTVLGIMRDTIKDTPVDSGRLRNNWFASIGQPVSQEREMGKTKKGNTSKAASASNANAVDVANKFKMGEEIYFTNNLPYAMVIEFGGVVNGSVRKGQGMLRRAIGIRTSKLR